MFPPSYGKDNQSNYPKEFLSYRAKKNKVVTFHSEILLVHPKTERQGFWSP